MDDFEIDMYKIDFSMFHPLDHFPGTTRCLTFYPVKFDETAKLPATLKEVISAVTYHNTLAWDLKWRGWLKRNTTCKLGRHELVSWGQSDKVSYMACTHCFSRGEEDGQQRGHR
jgi:hypothetical protein